MVSMFEVPFPSSVFSILSLFWPTVVQAIALIALPRFLKLQWLHESVDNLPDLAETSVALSPRLL